MAKKKQNLTPEERLAAALVPEEEWPYALPDGWKWVRIGALNDYKSSSITPSTNPDDTFELYSVPSIVNDYPEITKGMDIGSTKQLVEKDDVLLCKINPRINRVWKVSAHTTHKCLASSEWIVVRARSFFASDYLMWFFRCPYFRERMLSNVSGVGGSLMRAKPRYVQTYPVALPPLSEQHRLVARIESLFAKLDAAREKVQSVLDSHETRKAALLHDAFTGKLTAKWREEHGISLVNWQTRSLSDCGTWKGGGTPSKAHPDYWENGEIMWVTSKDMKSDKIQDTQMHITPLGVEQSSAIYSEKPAVLFVTRSGILRHTLPVALVNRPFTTNQDLKSLTPNENIDTQYLFFAAKAFSGQILKTCMKNGTTVESINTKKLMEFLLPIASMREQKVIAKMLRQLLNKEQRARQAAEETLTAIDRMKQSILARAFRGEL